MNARERLKYAQLNVLLGGTVHTLPSLASNQVTNEMYGEFTLLVPDLPMAHYDVRVTDRS